MKFTATPLEGAWLVESQPAHDERGWFARTFDRDLFRQRGLAFDFPQHSSSFNRRRGTLRGMHYQAAPHEEAKLVRCTAGAIHDVIIDLRSRRTFAIELSAANRLALYVPPAFAHGFLTLADDTEVSYLIDHPYDPESARGVRWNDPAFAIEWPFAPVAIAARDAAFPDFGE